MNEHEVAIYIRQLLDRVDALEELVNALVDDDDSEDEQPAEPTAEGSPE